jgi:hypothetical protein
MEGPKGRSLSCLIEELCSERKQSSSNMDEDFLLDANCSCTNSPLRIGSIKEEIVPQSMPSIVSGIVYLFIFLRCYFSLVKNLFLCLSRRVKVSVIQKNLLRAPKYFWAKLQRTERRCFCQF